MSSSFQPLLLQTLYLLSVVTLDTLVYFLKICSFFKCLSSVGRYPTSFVLSNILWFVKILCVDWISHLSVYQTCTVIIHLSLIHTRTMSTYIHCWQNSTNHRAKVCYLKYPCLQYPCLHVEPGSSATIQPSEVVTFAQQHISAMSHKDKKGVEHYTKVCPMSTNRC